MIDARIGGLEVQGFRRFQTRETFTFHGPNGLPPDTLVVAGPNGCGKTAFFEAIMYGLGREGLLHPELDDEHHRRWLQGALAPDVHVKLTLAVSSAPNTILGARAPCSVEITRTHVGWSVRAGEDAKPVSDDDGVIRALLNELSVTWFSSWRHPYLPGAVRPMSDPPTRARSESGRLWQVKQRIVDERTRSAFTGTPGHDVVWLDALTHAWSALRGEDGTCFSVVGDESDAKPTRFDLYLQHAVKDFGDISVCSVDQLSSGELEWIALVGTLITDNFEGIVLIDEPELHLNLDWQARLVPALRAVVPTSQIILATHADPPWDQAYSFERVLLVPPGDPRARFIK